MTATAAISRKVHFFNLPQEATSKVLSSKTSSKTNKSSVSIEFKEDTQHDNSKEQSQLEKTPSKVKESIAAFESSLLSQERVPYTKLTTAKPQSIREIMDAHNKEQTSEGISAQNIDSPIYNIKRVVDPSSNQLLEHPTYAKDEEGPIEIHDTSYESKCVDNMEQRMESKKKSHEKASMQKGKYPLHNIGESQMKVPYEELSRSSNLKLYEIPGKVLHLLLDKSQPTNSVTEQRFASVLPHLSETQRAHLKHPRDRLRPEISGRRHRCSCPNFHGWIFLEEAICSCIASDNRTVVDLLGDYNVNTKTYPRKLVDDGATSGKEKNLSGLTKKPETSHSSSSGASKGPNGQVMKIIIMVGFGLLVLLTRKRKSR